MLKVRIWLLKGLLWLLSRLPLCVHYVLGGFVAWLMGSVFRYRRKVVEHNLELCFPEKSEQERKAIRRGFYRHLGEVIGEAVWFGGCHNAQRLHRQRLVESENPEEVAALLAAAPNLVLLSSHCGNWELHGGVASYSYDGKPAPLTEQNYVVVYREQTSKVWDKVLHDNRIAPLEDPKHYEGLVETNDIIRYILRHKDEQKIYDFRTDQRPYKTSQANIPVQFLGQQVYTMTGAAGIAHKFGWPVAFLSMRRERRGHYKLRYVTICTDASKMSIEDIMQQYYTLLEKDIREQPETNLWTHRRFARHKNFKTQ